MIRISIAVPLLLVLFNFAADSQDRPKPGNTATVTVRAVNAVGSGVSNPKVDAFVDEEGKSRVDLFRGRPTARGVPFGRYRITVRADDFRPSTFYVEVNDSDVLVTAGLDWYGVENIPVTARLSGKLTGFPASLRDWWCKASGLYAHLEFESAVNPITLHFDFGEVPPGTYLVACVANQKFVAVRTIRVAADTEPFSIDYKPEVDGEPVKH